MPGSVTSPASLITRLPADKQARALQRLSRHANAPGSALKQTNGRPQRRFQRRVGELGIILIETNVTGALAANVGTRQPPNVGTVTIDTAAGTPATVDITTDEQDPVTWAGAGTYTLSVTVPANCQGQTRVTV